MLGRVEAVIDENGDVKIEVHGVSGPKCMEMTKELEDLLGKVAQRTKKPEFSQSQKVGQKAKVKA